MLVLTRKENESIEITLPDSQQLTIMVTEVERGRARIGIEAPTEIKILRSELVQLPTPAY